MPIVTFKELLDKLEDVDIPGCDYCGRVVLAGPPCCKFSEALAAKDREIRHVKGCWAAAERGLSRKHRILTYTENVLFQTETARAHVFTCYAKAIADLEKLGIPQIWMGL